MKSAKMLLIAALLAAHGTIIAVPSADACGSGQICYWGEDAYTGCDWSTPYDDSNLSNNFWFNCSSYSVNNGANSLANYGNSCTILVFDYTNYTGGFFWFSRVGLGGVWADSNLGNNHWYMGDGGVLENDITSHNFCA